MKAINTLRLDRRTLLRGAGSIAIALPWLEIMGCPSTAGAADTVLAKRFISVYTPGGTVLEKFWPSSLTDPTSSPILSPLAELKDQLLVLEGLDYRCKQGEQHQAGIIAFLTGSEQNGSPGNYSKFASIDQVIASKISKNIKKRASLQLAVRWATGRSKGLLHPINCVNFEDNEACSPIPPLLDPQAIFKELFGSLDPSGSAEAAALTETRKSVLDFVDKRYAALAQKLGAKDKARLEEHLTKIRELELGLDKVVEETSACRAPTLIDTSSYEPSIGLDITEAERDKVQSGALETDKLIPAVGKLMMDMMVMALACDITAVGSFQWTDTEAKHTFPWLELKEHHHFYQHDGGFRAPECEKICTWYTEMHAYLLQSMAAVDMGGGKSLLDESVVLFGSELAHPPTHTNESIPLILAGGGGGLKGGRHLSYGGRPHNDLLTALVNLFGDTRASYGLGKYNTGALADLTG